MNVNTFIQQNRDDWKRLNDLNISLTKSKKNITKESVEEFQRLYQSTTYHLSYSRTYFPQEEVTLYLNELVSKSHNLLYRDQSTSKQQLIEFFGRRFIGMLLEQRRFVLAAAFLFLLGGIGGFLSIMDEPLNLYTILPAEIAHYIDPGQLGTEEITIDSASVSASIMTNNIRVALLAFLGGITFGIFTVYLLIYNGILIGALAALFLQYGKSYDFWAFIVPHGIIELCAIFIAGGSGLLMGYRILVPGSYPRSFQFRYQAVRSVQLLLGTIPLFILAGIIEGYITPAPISLEWKYGFALMTALGLLLYLWFGKRALAETVR